MNAVALELPAVLPDIEFAPWQVVRVGECNPQTIVERLDVFGVTLSESARQCILSEHFKRSRTPHDVELYCEPIERLWPEKLDQDPTFRQVLSQIRHRGYLHCPHEAAALAAIMGAQRDNTPFRFMMEPFLTREVNRPVVLYMSTNIRCTKDTVPPRGRALEVDWADLDKRMWLRTSHVVFAASYSLLAV